MAVDDLIESISPRTSLVSISWACGLTGVIQPLEEIASICKQRSIWLHVDATHVAGKLQIDFSELPIDILTFNGAQIGAPIGTGGLLAKNGIPIQPLVFGAPLNVAGLVALGEAAHAAQEQQNLYCTEVAYLRDRFEQEVQKAYPEAVVLFSSEERIPHASCIAFPGISNELLCFVFKP